MSHPRAARLWKRMYVSGLTDDGFEEQVARAAAVGATHVEISKLPQKPRHEKTDPTDPYLEYSFLLGCLFRFSVPDELRSMTPVEYEQKARGALKRRCEVLRHHGLRGRLWMLEPHSLPPEIFEAHPEWRGPRVEYPPRAKRPYHAPCIDHPAVLALYRKAVADLLRECPEIETFRLTTNDSASGICWSEGLYSGCNGPSACRERPYGERVRGFLQAWLDGAADAGVDARVLLSPRGMSAAQAEAARLVQPDGGVVLPTPIGAPNTHAGGGGPAPTVGIPDPIPFLDDLAVVLNGEEAHISLGCETHWRILEKFVERPARTHVEKASLLAEVAAEFAGAGGAETLIEVWRRIARALGRIEFLPMQGLIFEHGLMSKRWITRPFVPFPEELTAEERDYWRPFLFEAGGWREVENLCNVHATTIADGVPHGRAVHKVCQSSMADLDRAAGMLEELRGEDRSEELPLLALRLRALRSLFRTCGNAVLFQMLLDKARAAFPEGAPRPIFPFGGQDRVELTNLLRDEMDNAAELAALLDDAPAALLAQGARPEDEDPYVLPPDLARKLRLKAVIVQRHLPDVDRLFPYANQQGPG